MSANVLVTDGDQRAALAVVRSLGRAGFRVHVCSPSPWAIAAVSRYTVSHTVTPDALAEPDRFVEAVSHAVRTTAADVLLPITDPSVIAVLGRAGALAPVKIPLPPLEVYRTASDKAAVAELARAVGLAVPDQRVVAARNDGFDPSAVRFPVVLKPHRSVAAGMKHGVRYASTPAELDAALSAMPEPAFPVLIQERIVGPGAGLFLLLWDGRVAAAFAHRRLLEKPPSGGVSVRSESIVPAGDLLDRAERLLRSLRWQGVAMVECKLDSATGRAFLMEVNGRFWGSLQLAIDAGVDFPAILVRLALGLPAAPVTAWRAGARLRWSLGEVDHVVARIRRSRRALALPPDAPGLGTVIAGMLTAPFAGVRGEVLRWHDPAPAMREALNWLRGR